MKTYVLFRGKEYEIPANSIRLAISRKGMVRVYPARASYHEYSGMWYQEDSEVFGLYTICKVKPPKQPHLELYKLEAVK